GRVAELASASGSSVRISVVETPALQRAVGKARAGVIAAAADRDGAREADHRDRGGVRGTRGGRAGKGSVAEGAVVVEPPAAHRRVLEERALMERPGFDRRGGIDAGRRELLGLPGREGGGSRRHGHGLSRDLVRGQSEYEGEGAQGEEARLAPHLKSPPSTVGIATQGAFTDGERV